MVWGGRPRAGTQGPLEGQQHQRDEKGERRGKGMVLRSQPRSAPIHLRTQNVYAKLT